MITSDSTDFVTKSIPEVLAQFPAGTPAGDVTLIDVPNTSMVPVPLQVIPKYKNVLRVCNYNDEKIKHGDKRGLIYDKQIWIDGVLRGFWLKQGSRQNSYWLADGDGARVELPSGYDNWVVARNSKRFDYHVNRHLNLLTPASSHEELKARREAQEIEKAVETERRNRLRRMTERRNRLRRINALSPLMYDLLQSIYSKGSAQPEDFQKMFKIRCQVEDGKDILTDV